MLARIQRGIEALYRIETDVSVLDFVIDESVRETIDPQRRAREQLFVTADGDVALFVCEHALENLRTNDPSDELSDDNLEDFLLAVEGVSHFVYTAWRARSDYPVSALELELQAEVDKYVTCLLGDSTVERLRHLRRRLFDNIAFHDDLAPDEAHRYRVANANGYRYARSLERRFIENGRVLAMLRELRNFYRLPLNDKLQFIGRAA